MRSLLVPVDGSQQSLAAVRAALRAAREGETRIDLLHVQPLFHRHIAQFVRRAQRDAWRESRTEEALEHARRLLAQSQVPWRAHVAVGDVAGAILSTAQSLRSDEIVLGTSRRGVVARWLAGSVSTRLLEGSAVPVRVIPAAPAPAYDRLVLPAGLGLIAFFFWAAE